MKKSLYKRIDRETSCWGLDAGCRRYVSNNATTRKFRKEMRKHARKRIDRKVREFTES
jgi:hypothetical protein